MFFLSVLFQQRGIYLLWFVSWAHCMPFKLNADTEEKLTNKINSLLNLKSQNLNLKSKDNNVANPLQTKSHNPISSGFMRKNVVGIDGSSGLFKPNALESQYSDAVQKMFQSAKSPLVKDKESLVSAQTLSDQLSMESFIGGESVALLAAATDKSADEDKTEKPEILVAAAKPVLSNMNKNASDSTLATSKSIDPTFDHKSAGSKFLASMSPEEFLKRLKKHLEISKSNLRILKKNFHDFLKEKEKLFRLNQKVSQEHPHGSKEINVSVIRAQENGNDASFAQESHSSVAFPTVNYPQPISQICPKDCPVNMIHIEHHHHGNSPIPCICENDNLYTNMREDASITDFEAFPLKSFKSKLTSNSVQLKASKSNMMSRIDESDETKSSEKNIDHEDSDATSEDGKEINGEIQSQNKLKDTNDDTLNDHHEVRDNSIPKFAIDKSQDTQVKSKVVNTIPKYYGGCEKPTTHIPAACDIACVPCKTPSPECTSCFVCPKNCPPNCIQGSVVTRDPPSNLCPPICPAKCPPITCPPTCPTTTTKCTTTCPPTCAPKCPCSKLREEAEFNAEPDSRSRYSEKKEIWKSNSKLTQLQEDPKIEEGSEAAEPHSNTAKLTMEDMKCSTPVSCCPTTCPVTCPTTCCTECPCPDDGSKSCPSCLCLEDNGQPDRNSQVQEEP